VSLGNGSAASEPVAETPAPVISENLRELLVTGR
jgi:hypothetical protein